MTSGPLPVMADHFRCGLIIVHGMENANEFRRVDECR